MKRIIYLFICICTLPMSARAADSTEEWLTRLDQSLDRRAEFEQQRMNRIETLKSELAKVDKGSAPNAVMDRFAQDLKTLRPAFVTGRETAVKKEQSVQRFMQGKTDLCCVSLRAASGLNLQRATCVVFGELDWSPAVHSQAEDRAHRIGHEDSLLCYYLVAPAGSDHDMQEALGLKVSQFEGLMGDTPISPEKQAENAGYARRHVERLALERISHSPGGARREETDHP